MRLVNRLAEPEMPIKYLQYPSTCGPFFKIFGSDGAAVLLGMKPTRLASRIKALRIKKGKVDS